MDIGARIKVLREKRGLTQNKLAEWAGVSQTHLRRVELGEADITVGHLELLCDALGITLAEFFSDVAEEDEFKTTLSTLSVKQKELLLAFLRSLNS